MTSGRGEGGFVVASEWVLCFVGLCAATALAVMKPTSPLQGALFMGASVVLAAIACGLHRPRVLVAFFGVGVAGGLAIPGVFTTILMGALALLFLLLVVLHSTTPFTITRASPGLRYSVAGRERVIPALDFTGSRPLMLKQEVLDDLLRLATYADSFLTRNGIRYIAAYGTVLGAVRHGGLIPWDDDVDFSIYRAADLERLTRDFEALAAEVARDGFILFRHGKYWKLAPNNFWRYPVVDLYAKACDPGPDLEPERVAFENITLWAAQNRLAWITGRYGPAALTQAVHGIPFWDSGFVPACVRRLFGYRVFSAACDVVEVLFAPRGV